MPLSSSSSAVRVAMNFVLILLVTVLIIHHGSALETGKLRVTIKGGLGERTARVPTSVKKVITATTSRPYPATNVDRRSLDLWGQPNSVGGFFSWLFDKIFGFFQRRRTSPFYGEIPSHSPSSSGLQQAISGFGSQLNLLGKGKHPADQKWSKYKNNHLQPQMNGQAPHLEVINHMKQLVQTANLLLELKAMDEFRRIYGNNASAPNHHESSHSAGALNKEKARVKVKGSNELKRRNDNDGGCRGRDCQDNSEEPDSNEFKIKRPSKPRPAVRRSDPISSSSEEIIVKRRRKTHQDEEECEDCGSEELSSPKRYVSRKKQKYPSPGPVVEEKKQKVYPPHVFSEEEEADEPMQQTDYSRISDQRRTTFKNDARQMHSSPDQYYSPAGDYKMAPTGQTNYHAAPKEDNKWSEQKTVPTYPNPHIYQPTSSSYEPQQHPAVNKFIQDPVLFHQYHLPQQPAAAFQGRHQLPTSFQHPATVRQDTGHQHHQPSLFQHPAVVHGGLNLYLGNVDPYWVLQQSLAGRQHTVDPPVQHSAPFYNQYQQQDFHPGKENTSRSENHRKTHATAHYESHQSNHDAGERKSQGNTKQYTTNNNGRSFGHSRSDKIVEKPAFQRPPMSQSRSKSVTSTSTTTTSKPDPVVSTEVPSKKHSQGQQRYYPAYGSTSSQKNNQRGPHRWHRDADSSSNGIESILEDGDTKNNALNTGDSADDDQDYYDSSSMSKKNSTNGAFYHVDLKVTGKGPVTDSLSVNKHITKGSQKKELRDQEKAIKDGGVSRYSIYANDAALNPDVKAQEHQPSEPLSRYGANFGDVIVGSSQQLQPNFRTHHDPSASLLPVYVPTVKPKQKMDTNQQGDRRRISNSGGNLMSQVENEIQ